MGTICAMSDSLVGTPSRPLRVAVIGSGPSGFYVVQALLKAEAVAVTVDVFDRLLAPYGLVRYGVAPDHQKIKNVTKVYARLAGDARVRFFGGVEVGRDLTVEDLHACYDAVAFCSGAQTDRPLGIPGEDLVGSHPATAFVAWYNGHPDFRHLSFELDCEQAVVVGVGNVALDVARMLCRTPEELEATDVATHALEALRHSRIREVFVLGRRGPAQAAFTNSELEELARMQGADARTLPQEVALDALSREDVEEAGDRRVTTKVALLEAMTRPPEVPKQKTLWLRFLVSPTALVGDSAGRVRSVDTVHNVLVRRPDGSLRPQPTNDQGTIPAGLVFRAVGYRGVPLPGVPFREDWGTIPHEAGRVLHAPGGRPVPGEYVAGWIKRGPSGVIGTNRPCSEETARSMLVDLKEGRMPEAAAPEPAAVEELLRGRGIRWVAFDEWERLDRLEVARGEALGRPRVKMVARDEMFDALD